jgi:hypothetical protein
MSSLTGTDAAAAYEGDLDRVSSRRLRHYLQSDRLLQPSAWRSLLAEVNSGVFPGQGTAYQLDALEFLSHAQGDVVYLDPPYAGTTAYEREYAALDDLLENEVREASGYSRSVDPLDELFHACAHIPIWLISLNNAAIDGRELGALAGNYKRNVRVVEIPYRHLGSIASEAKNAANKEYLVLATD